LDNKKKALKVKFWGVRGSIACPGPETVKFGGNTPCLELRFGAADRLIIVDAGTGIRPLGNYLLQNDLPKGPINTEIFLTHTHWDHIIGFPFFAPIYIPGSKLTVYGPVTYEEDSLKKIIGELLRYRYFPVSHSELQADIAYIQLKECKMDLGGGIMLVTKFLNHPLLCLGYRFEFSGKVLCTAYDTEPFRNIFPTDADSPDYDPIASEKGEEAAREENQKLLNFFKGADLLIYDCQYTQEEYVSAKIGWGHSFYEHAINSALEADATRIVFFHHDPQRTDSELLAIEKYYRELKNNTTLEIIVAREGMEIEL